MFDELMLPEQGDLHQKDGITQAALALRLPWYRSLPISCIDGIDLVIDGVAVAGDDVTISVGDADHKLADTGNLAEVEWFVLDRATVRFPLSTDFPVGSHEVDLTLTVRIPYAEPEYWPIDFTQVAKYSRKVEFLGKDS